MVDVQEFISQRILHNCWQQYMDKHYRAAAHEAMIQVEQALKDKRYISDNKFGQPLINLLFAENGTKDNYPRLIVPLSDALQDEAKHLFKGAFAYYRNYTAHDGSNIDKKTCFRIMILASELLDLIDASSLSFTDIGGIKGLLKHGVFKNADEIRRLLAYLDGTQIIGQDYGGFYEGVYTATELDEEQVMALFDLDLVRYKEIEFIPDLEQRISGEVETTVGFISLTETGKQFLEESSRT